MRYSYKFSGKFANVEKCDAEMRENMEKILIVDDETEIADKN